MNKLRSSTTLSWNHHSLILLFILLLLSSTTSPSSPYENPCTSIIPRPSWDTIILSPNSFQIQPGYFRANGKFFGLDPSPHSASSVSMVKFISVYVSETSTSGVLHIRGSLYMYFDDNQPSVRWGTGYRPWRFYPLGGGWKSFLDGYWSKSDGKLCMTGTTSGFRSRGNHTFHSVLILNVTSNSTILTSLVTGTLESVDSESLGSVHFDPISILGYNQNKHNYTLISETKKACDGIMDGEESLSLGTRRSICSIPRATNMGFELYYETNCSSRNCNPFGKSFGFLPSYVDFNAMECLADGRLQMYITFSNASFYRSIVPFDPDTTLVGEGLWDGEKNRLCVTACQIMNSTHSLQGSFVGDCTTQMSLRFPAILTITNRSLITGQIWSTKKEEDSDFFDRIPLQSFGIHEVGVHGLKYEYTKINWLIKVCSSKEIQKSAKRYPNGASSRDMRFRLYGTSNVSHVTALFMPLFLGDEYQQRYMIPRNSAAKMPNQRLWNVSYTIELHLPPPKWDELTSRGREREIAAEGIYDAETGSLCMAGCRYLGQSFHTLDCEMTINVQFPPLNRRSNGGFNGTICSTRERSDPLFFEPIQLYSHVPYVEQAAEVMKTMDQEIIMVLISLTLACAFIGSQLFYVKHHPDVLPSISVVMVSILTVGLMIPLVLNFEALFFKSHSKPNLLLGSGGWLEENEVIVRVITMVAFLLQFRLLQLTVSARRAEASEQGFSAVEKRVLKWCLPLYFVGGLIAWLAHLAKTNGATTPKPHHSFWDYLLSYAGLVLDGFLLPQVLLNLFSNSKGKALAVSFYGGMTLVRALPHVYDAYRARDFLPWFQESVIYADPNRDFYSTSWDIIIPCGALVLAVLVSLQQWLGGGCILPRRLRGIAGYEQVSEVEM